MANDEQPMSQEDIDKLINNLEASGLGPEGDIDAADASGDIDINSIDLDGVGGGASGGSGGVDLDAVGEMTNIAFGAGSTTLSGTLNMDVSMSTPTIRTVEVIDEFAEPFAGEEKLYALSHFNDGQSRPYMLILKTEEAKALAETMLGNDASAMDPGAPTDMQMGGIAEALSQMLNAAASSMGTLMNTSIEASNPTVAEYNHDQLATLVPELATNGFILSEFSLKIGDNLHLELALLQASSDVETQIASLMSLEPDESTGVPQMATGNMANQGQMGGDPMAGMAAGATATAQPGGGGFGPQQMGGAPGGGGYGPQPGMGNPSQGGYYQTHPQQPQYAQANPVTVQPVQFSNFDTQVPIYGEHNKNLELVMDVTLNLTVELGRTNITIKEILELTRGSVLELDRIAGEPVDLLANGKLIAKGEVVVIEDNFGLRITSIVSPAERLRGL